MLRSAIALSLAVSSAPSGENVPRVTTSPSRTVCDYSCSQACGVCALLRFHIYYLVAYLIVAFALMAHVRWLDTAVHTHNFAIAQTQTVCWLCPVLHSLAVSLSFCNVA